MLCRFTGITQAKSTIDQNKTNTSVVISREECDTPGSVAKAMADLKPTRGL